MTCQVQAAFVGTCSLTVILIEPCVTCLGCEGSEGGRLTVKAMHLQVESINTMTALEDLILDGCTALTHLQVLLPCLRTASARCCPSLASVRPVCLELLLSGCSVQALLPPIRNLKLRIDGLDRR